MLQGISVFVLFLWIWSGESAIVFFPSTATNISNKILFSINLFEAIYFHFLYFSFCPSHPGKIYTATNDDTISLLWKQSKFYLSTYVVYVEAQRINHAKFGLYEVYGFQLIVNLLEKYLHLPQVTLLNRDSLQVNKSELGLFWLL